MSLAFVTSPLDRKGQLRQSPAHLAQFRADPASRLVRVSADAVVMRDGVLHLAHDGIDANAIYLGQSPTGTQWFATRAESDAPCVPIRAIMVDGLLAPDELSILAQARSLVGWHERHGFCANCGSLTAVADAGYRRTCDACKAEHFPRTDPVVIMAVRKDDQFLMGRQASWPANMYSALAGFMEPGETIEQAVRREVMEETAIEIGSVTYVASQPWPYPSSLMIGMCAEALSETITIDPKELETARWFSRSELEQMLVGTHPDGLWASRPQAIAHAVLSAAVRS